MGQQAAQFHERLMMMMMMMMINTPLPSLCNILHRTIHLHVEFLFFIKSQFTTTAQYVHMNQCTCGHS